MINYDLESSKLLDDIWKQKAIADHQFKHKGGKFYNSKTETGLNNASVVHSE